MLGIWYVLQTCYIVAVLIYQWTGTTRSSDASRFIYLRCYAPMFSFPPSRLGSRNVYLITSFCIKSWTSYPHMLTLPRAKSGSSRNEGGSKNRLHFKEAAISCELCIYRDSRTVAFIVDFRFSSRWIGYFCSLLIFPGNIWSHIGRALWCCLHRPKIEKCAKFLGGCMTLIVARWSHVRIMKQNFNFNISSSWKGNLFSSRAVAASFFYLKDRSNREHTWLKARELKVQTSFEFLVCVILTGNKTPRSTRKPKAI